MKQILYFTASWCGPCKSMKPIIDDLISQGSNIQKIDIDDNPETTKRYNVSSVPTFVLVKNNMEISRKVGVQAKQTLLKLLE